MMEAEAAAAAAAAAIGKDAARGRIRDREFARAFPMYFRRSRNRQGWIACVRYNYKWMRTETWYNGRLRSYRDDVAS
jgi:hypothetical protein